jgi:hypothetical protein
MVVQKLWLRVKEASPVTGLSEKAIYEQIRTGIFPFEYRRAGTSILISARDLGVIPEGRAENSEAQDQDQSFAATA